MTYELARAAWAHDFSVERRAGVSAMAVRTVLREMAQVCRADGWMPRPMRGSKLAALTKLTPAVMYRARKWLIEHGYVEQLLVGGGRTVSRWRVVIDRLRESASPEVREPDSPRERAQSVRQIFGRPSSVPPLGVQPPPPPRRSTTAEAAVSAFAASAGARAAARERVRQAAEHFAPRRGAAASSPRGDLPGAGRARSDHAAPPPA